MRAAYELGLSVRNGQELVVESLEWIVKRKEELLRQLQENSITKQAFDEEWAEIGLLHQQIKAFSEQLEVSENKLKKPTSAPHIFHFFEEIFRKLRKIRKFAK